MEWITRKESTSRDVAPEDVKVCGLCATLNHVQNAECFTCGWRGTFRRDAATIMAGWRRLQDEYGAVRLEHLTARGAGRPEVVGLMAMSRRPARHRQWWQTWLERLSPSVPKPERPSPSRRSV
jgi:hypothetical protein